MNTHQPRFLIRWAPVLHPYFHASALGSPTPPSPSSSIHPHYLSYVLPFTFSSIHQHNVSYLTPCTSSSMHASIIIRYPTSSRALFHPSICHHYVPTSSSIHFPSIHHHPSIHPGLSLPPPPKTSVRDLVLLQSICTIC